MGLRPALWTLDHTSSITCRYLPGLNTAIKLMVWLGSRVVSVLDSGAEGPGFKSQPRRCRVTVLGKLLTPVVRCASVHQAAKLVAALLRVARRKVMAAYRRVYDSRHLQADCQEPGSAPEPYARQSSMGYL